MASLRIAIGQISSESNHFAYGQCELELFRRTGYLCEGADLFKLADAGSEIGGILAVLASAADVEIVPLLAARANSSGPLSESCYAYLTGKLLAALRDARPIHGLILANHGAMAATNEPDCDGDLAIAARAITGPDVPIVMTLDLHAAVTRRMVEATNAIVGYRHYPHDDVRATGSRGASLLLKAARGEVRPVIGCAHIPMLMGAFHGATLDGEPFGQLMHQAERLEKEPGVLSASLFWACPYNDVPDIASSSLVVADDNVQLAIREARTLAGQFWARRREFDVETVSVEEAVRRGREIDGGPVLLLDSADTTGGGAAGDSIHLVKHLLANHVSEPCLAMVVDPQAVQACLNTTSGPDVTVEIGHKTDPAWGSPLDVTGKVVGMCDGHFRYTGGILGGSEVSMGPSVVLQVGSIRVLIMSYPTYDWADEQYRTAGLDPAEYKFVGVKNMMNFRFGYRDSMKGYFLLNLPGPTPADSRMLPYRRVTRPLYPIDGDLSEPQIRVSQSRPCRGDLGDVI